MTLFGGNDPQHDVWAPPDCMTSYVYEELKYGYDDIDAYTMAETPESVFAWVMLEVNFVPVKEVVVVQI